MANQDGALSGLKGLVVLDGNWAQAKALWWRNAWLTRLRRFVIVPDGPSLYGNLRKEARPDAVSTLEAIGLALSALEGGDVRERLLVPFRDLLAEARTAGGARHQTPGSSGPALAPIVRRMLDQPQLPVSQRTNPERSFKDEVRALRLGEGEVFRGEGILAVTKAILQAGVSYVGGYRARRSRIWSTCWSKARTCSTSWASSRDLHQRIIGRRAARRLDQLSDPGLRHLEVDRRHQRRCRRALQPLLRGVIGGALIVVGEDYGEGAASPRNARMPRR